MKKVVLITGGSSGIGESTAIKMQENGWIVYAAARRLDRKEHLKAKGINIITLDVSVDESMVNCINHIKDAEGRIDALVNNAGYGSYGALEDVPLSEAKYQFEVNVFGLGRLSQLVLPMMRAQNSGSIVNISSIGGKTWEPHGAWYHATKFAVEGLSDCLRMEVKQFNINVVVIQPGAILTEWSAIARKKLLDTSGKTAYKGLVDKHVAMLAKYDGQGSKPEVVANAITKACNTNKPKTRYAVGSGAKMPLTLKSLLSDRWFDKFMFNLTK
ncbi:oxidoreductase [Maribacter litoralis]|uniref:oxidoreductase n=1 Tax=Maribacter litoralis TaxID=2059726 RepID=UPI003F5CE6BA